LQRLRREKHTQFLYWFTQQELHPVSPYPKVNFTKKNQSFTKPSWFLNPPRTKNTMLKNFILVTPTLQETLSRSAITNTLIKENYKNENT